jgi:hypothetical protein
MASKGDHMRITPLLLVCSFVLSAPAFSQAVGPAEKPEVQPGDSWVYENTTFPAEAKRQFTVRVRDVTPDSIMTGRADDGSVFTRDWSLREIKRAGEVTFKGEPGRPQLQFPLDVGKRWNGNSTATLPNGVQRWQGEASVQKVEKVTVPAGTFDAYLVRYEGYYNTVNGRGNVRWVETIWYAPEARRWIKRDWTWTVTHPGEIGGRWSERQVEELIAFKPAKTAPRKTADTSLEK